MGLFGIQRPLETLRAAALAAAAASAAFGAGADAKENPPDLRPLLRAEAGRPADQPEGGMVAERDAISNDAAKRFRAAFPEGGVGVVDLNLDGPNGYKIAFEEALPDSKMAPNFTETFQRQGSEVACWWVQDSAAAPKRKGCVVRLAAPATEGAYYDPPRCSLRGPIPTPAVRSWSSRLELRFTLWHELGHAAHEFLYESAADAGIDQNSMKENAAETFAALMVLREGATEDNLAWIAATRSWGPFVAGEAEHWLADADLNALEAWRAHKNEIRALDLRSTFLYAMALAKTTALSFQDARRILLSYAYTTRRRWTVEESLVHAEEIARKEGHPVLHRFAAAYAASVASRLRPEEARAVLDSLGQDASLLGVGGAPTRTQAPAKSRSAPIRASEEGLR